MQTGSRVSCTERLWALREERGQPDRAGRGRKPAKKRKSNLSTPSLIFIQTWESSFASHASTPPISLFLYYPPPLSLCPFYYLFPFTFFPLIMTGLISSLTYSIDYSWATGEEKSSRVHPASRKQLQLKDKPVLKHLEKLLVTRLEFLGLFQCFPFQWLTVPNITWHHVDMFLENNRKHLQ